MTDVALNSRHERACGKNNFWERNRKSEGYLLKKKLGKSHTKLFGCFCCLGCAF